MFAILKCLMFKHVHLIFKRFRVHGTLLLEVCTVRCLNKVAEAMKVTEICSFKHEHTFYFYVHTLYMYITIFGGGGWGVGGGGD